MFQRAYIAVGLTIIMSGMFWLGFNYLLTGFGLPFGMGVCTGMGLALSLMFFGGLWAEGARKRDERRRTSMPVRRT
jgi:hypothetical protein